MPNVIGKLAEGAWGFPNENVGTDSCFNGGAPKANGVDFENSGSVVALAGVKVGTRPIVLPVAGG